MSPDSRPRMRVDHMLLAVQDLDEATRDYRERLGMNAQVGGVHPGRGTHNSLVHFGTAYLELIAVNDPSAARAQEFVRFLAEGDGPYTFALAVADLEAASEALRARGLNVDPPRDGSRRTPEGALLRWRSADLRPGPGGPGPDAPPLPFLIHWEADEAGAAWFHGRVELGHHAVPWGALHALLVATPDPAGLAEEYERLFGWEHEEHGRYLHLSMSGGDSVNPALGPAPLVVLVAPPSDDASALDRLLSEAAAWRIARHGAGVLGMAIQVPNVDEVVADLERRGVDAQVHAEGRWGLVEPRDAHGMAIELVQSEAS